MNAAPSYTPFHPRWHRQRRSTWWWMKRGSYLLFILREMSSLFVAWFVVFFLLLIHALGHGPAYYAEFLDWARSPLVIALNAVSLAFVVLHAITWFNLAPSALAVRFQGKRVPGTWIAASNYAAWAVATAVAAWVILGA
jgi:fumarate reductase subunit C